jgi:hypothetical protein
MANGLGKKTFLSGHLEGTSVDILNKDTRELLFRGSLKAASKFIGAHVTTVHSAIRHKSICQKKYLITYSSEKQTNTNQ